MLQVVCHPPRGSCRWQRRCIVWLAPLLVALGSCRSARVARSDWPPEDFYLEVRGRTQTKDRLIERQSLHVYADGFAVYREADPEDAFPGDWPPVFSRVSAYRMLPESTRSLARGLYQAGLFQLETVVGTEIEAEDVVAIAVRAFGDERRSVARGRVYGAFTDVLHVVNAYLPSGCAFALPDMTGEPQPTRLSRVPIPAHAVDGALALHATWADRWETPDVHWRIEHIALALRAGDRVAARNLLEALERDRALEVAAFPDDDGASRESLARLRELVK